MRGTTCLCSVPSKGAGGVRETPRCEWHSCVDSCCWDLDCCRECCCSWCLKECISECNSDCSCCCCHRLSGGCNDCCCCACTIFGLVLPLLTSKHTLLPLDSPLLAPVTALVSRVAVDSPAYGPPVEAAERWKDGTLVDPAAPRSGIAGDRVRPCVTGVLACPVALVGGSTRQGSCCFQSPLAVEEAL
jgi:hypothetical protein